MGAAPKYKDINLGPNYKKYLICGISHLRSNMNKYFQLLPYQKMIVIKKGVSKKAVLVDYHFMSRLLSINSMLIKLDSASYIYPDDEEYERQEQK